MKAKLFKMIQGYSLSLTDDIDDIYALSDDKLADDHKLHKLSIENCEFIENGYNLSDLIDQEYHNHIDEDGEAHWDTSKLYHRKEGFKDGFNKFKEINSNKKFTIEDIEIAMISMKNQEIFYEKTYKETEESRLDYIQSYLKYLSKTKNEWSVEIETEDSFEKNDDNLFLENGNGDFYTHNKKLKLDSNGKLILKLI